MAELKREDEDDGGGQLNQAGGEDHEEGIGFNVGAGEDEAVVDARRHKPQEEGDEAAAAHHRGSNQRHLVVYGGGDRPKPLGNTRSGLVAVSSLRLLGLL